MPLSAAEFACETTLGMPSADRPALRVVFDAMTMPQSPSLDSPRHTEPAREVKVLLTEAQAGEVEARLRSQLSLDPHSGPDGYHLTTLYCDTPQLDVFHRRGRYRLFKFRLRRYGLSNRVYLERKSKQGTIVRKRRSTIELAELSQLGGCTVPCDSKSPWYHSQLLRNGLQPVSLIEYDRLAYFGECESGPLRLTFDRNVSGSLTQHWSLLPACEGAPLLSGRVVCEFKFRGPFPATIKSLLHDLQLTTCGVSKYRHCMTHWTILNDAAASPELRISC